MPKWLKYAAIAVVGVVAVIALVIWLAFANLNDIIKAAIEQVGGELTGTEVAIDDVDISLEDGRGALRGFRVVNPDGFTRDNAFSFGEVEVELDTSTIFDDVVVIREVKVVRPKITYELAGEDDNLNTLKRNTTSNAERLQKEAGGRGGAPHASGETEDGQKFVIEQVNLIDGEIRVRATQLTDRTLDVPLPNVTLRDIGKDEGGADPAAIAEEVMGGLLDNVTAAASQIDVTGLLKDAGALAEGAVDAATDAAAGAADAAAEQAGAAAKAVEDRASGAVDGAADAAKNAGDAVRGLFGN